MGTKRGFSSMDPQKQREIASKGGKAAHQKGTAHEFTSEEARIAGRKGGAASRAKRAGLQENVQQQPVNESPSDAGRDQEMPVEAAQNGDQQL